MRLEQTKLKRKGADIEEGKTMGKNLPASVALVDEAEERAAAVEGAVKRPKLPPSNPNGMKMIIGMSGSFFKKSVLQQGKLPALWQSSRRLSMPRKASPQRTISRRSARPASPKRRRRMQAMRRRLTAPRQRSRRSPSHAAPRPRRMASTRNGMQSELRLMTRLPCSWITQASSRTVSPAVCYLVLCLFVDYFMALILFCIVALFAGSILEGVPSPFQGQEEGNQAGLGCPLRPCC